MIISNGLPIFIRINEIIFKMAKIISVGEYAKCKKCTQRNIQLRIVRYETLPYVISITKVAKKCYALEVPEDFSELFFTPRP